MATRCLNQTLLHLKCELSAFLGPIFFTSKWVLLWSSGDSQQGFFSVPFRHLNYLTFYGTGVSRKLTGKVKVIVGSDLIPTSDKESAQMFKSTKQRLFFICCRLTSQDSNSCKTSGCALIVADFKALVLDELIQNEKFKNTYMY